MSSEDSDDEPLSVLAALKRDKSGLEILPIYNNRPDGSPEKINLRKKCDVSISIQPVYQNEQSVVERPLDVWLYLTDFYVTGPYTCLLCSEWFLNRNRVVIHYVIDHKKEYCGICRYLVPSREAWWEHQKFHLPWKCPQCTENFDSQIELRKHFTGLHKLLYCWFCSLRLNNEDEYKKHLFQKHSVTNTISVNVDKLWEFECKGTQKFVCVLCSKSHNVGKEFVDHFMSYHHFTLKCFAFFITGIDLPFKVKGTNLTPKFIKTHLSNAVHTFGYIDFVKNFKIKEEPTVPDETTITVDCEPDLKELSENGEESEELKLDEEARGYKGVEDIDVTLLEVINMQKCYFDYIDETLNDIKSNTVPLSSDINYANIPSESRPITCCFCTEVFVKKSNFETHITRMHNVKTLPLYWCRVCAAVFDNLSELESHCSEELGEFDELWICQFCDKEFDGREATRNHLTEHWDELEFDNCFSPHLGFKCKFCPSLFWNETDRDSHHVKMHIQKHIADFYNCSLCGEVFGDKVFFIHHYMEKHNNDTHYLLKCTKCSVVLENVDGMRGHFRTHHPGCRKIFCCLDQCQFKPFSQRKSFFIHIKNFHSLSARNPQTCDKCGLEFSNKQAYMSHASQVHGPGRFGCNLCEQSLHTSDERKIHYLLKHPGRAQYQCKMCDKSFQHKSSLYMHRQTHIPSKKDFTCSYCGKSFMKKDSYREHLLIHEEPRHACSYCPMRFVQRSNMLRHERRHTGERPYTCQYCPRTFSDKGACTSHSRTHLKTTSFACVYCGQTFVQKSKLTYHIRKHTGENLETCSLCSKIFTNAGSLREHMRVHQKQKMKRTVKCPLCKKMYPTERDMMRHMRSTHTSAQLKCPLCTKCLGTNGSLREHVLTHSRVNTYQCLLCPKSYHVKKSMSYHLEKRHSLKPPYNTDVHYRHLDPKECDLGLDDDVIDKIFSKVRKKNNADLLIGDYVSFNRGIQLPNTQQSTNEKRSEVNESYENNKATVESIQIKIEPNDSENEEHPPDFVDVKIECVDEEQRSEAEY